MGPPALVTVIDGGASNDPAYLLSNSLNCESEKESQSTSRSRNES
jgi:hypothetical protein